MYFAIVSKTNPYTYLGSRPLDVAPEADLHSRLALTAFQRFDPVTLLGGVGSALRKGKFLRSRKGIARRHDLEGMRVVGRGLFPYQVDGDDLGDADGLDIGYEPEALAVVLP